MTAPERDKTELPWPHWMLRYVGSDDQDAMEDLIWSVGGSPPYGGVSYDEAGAVYELIEDYRGPGAASRESFERVQPFVAADPVRQSALEIFRYADEIQSAPESYGQRPVARGLALARAQQHRGAEASFLALEAGLHHRANDLPAARDCTLQALDIFLMMADEDPAYAKRVMQTAQNAVSFTAMAGDVDAARTLLHKLASVMDPAASEQLRRSLDAVQ
ncbi:MAG: hypothetical protein ABIZ91_01560 [Gemmatimonadaceae bacterium]